MSEKVIELIIVLDESGSMDNIKDKTIKSINGLLDEQRTAGPTNVTIVKFSNIPQAIVCGEDINNLSVLTSEDYDPNGRTALYDGIGMAIEMADKRNVIVNDNTGVMLVIVTDGWENASHKYNLLSIRELLQQKEKDDWIISYLGANIDSQQEAANIGATYAANWTTQEASIDALYSSVSDVSTFLRAQNLDLTSAASKDALTASIKAIYKEKLGNA